MYVINLKKRKNRKVSALTILCGVVMVFVVLIIGQGLAGVLAKATDYAITTMAINDTIPMTAVQKSENFDLVKLTSAIIGFDMTDPRSIIYNQVAFIGAARSVYNPEYEFTQELPDDVATQPIPENSGPILELDLHQEQMVRNSTQYSINVEGMLNENLKFDMSREGPKVLIVHTHTSEAYMPTAANFYYPSDPDRTEDTRYNVVRVGDEMTQILNDMGVETLHDRSAHDYPSYNGSYKSSLATVEEYLENYPSIQVVIDVHRDAMERADGTRLRGVTDIDGQKAAQVMIVCGSDEGGLTHPNWRENLKFAVRYQKVMNDSFPNLTRAIDFRQERFNMHTTYGSLILEVGSSANSLEEAIIGGRAAARSLGLLLNEL